MSRSKVAAAFTVIASRERITCGVTVATNRASALVESALPSDCVLTFHTVNSQAHTSQVQC
jgi:hypothetical protein